MRGTRVPSSNLHIIANPISGRGKVEARLPDLQAAARISGAAFEISTSPKDLRTRVARARDAGAWRIVIAGGDGSIHQAIQELAGSETALAVVPLGRGNDLAASIGVVKDFDAALALAFDGRLRQVDLGRLRVGRAESYFAVNCGAGVDSLAARLANRQRMFRGALGYPMAAAVELARFRSTNFDIDFGNGHWREPGMALIVANCWRFGGGMKVAPEARVDDGLLDVVFVKKAFKLRLLPLLAKVYSGSHVDHAAIAMARTAKLTLTLDRRLPVCGDGELMGEVGEEGVTIEAAPGALQVVAPG